MFMLHINYNVLFHLFSLTKPVWLVGNTMGHRTRCHKLRLIHLKIVCVFMCVCVCVRACVCVYSVRTFV